MRYYSARLSKNKIVLIQKCGEEKSSNTKGSKRKKKKERECGEKSKIKIIFMKQSMSLSEERSEKANAE